LSWISLHDFCFLKKKIPCALRCSHLIAEFAF